MCNVAYRTAWAMDTRPSPVLHCSINCNRHKLSQTIQQLIAEILPPWIWTTIVSTLKGVKTIDRSNVNNNRQNVLSGPWEVKDTNGSACFWYICSCESTFLLELTVGRGYWSTAVIVMGSACRHCTVTVPLTSAVPCCWSFVTNCSTYAQAVFHSPYC